MCAESGNSFWYENVCKEVWYAREKFHQNPIEHFGVVKKVLTIRRCCFLSPFNFLSLYSEICYTQGEPHRVFEMSQSNVKETWTYLFLQYNSAHLQRQMTRINMRVNFRKDIPKQCNFECLCGIGRTLNYNFRSFFLISGKNSKTPKTLHCFRNFYNVVKQVFS